MAVLCWLLATPAPADTGCADCHSTVSASPSAPPWREVTGRHATPVASSAMCLSCHDGVEATAAAHRGEHPVQVDYVAAAARRRAFLRPAGSPSGLGGSIEDDLLVAGRLECISCHDPHGGHREGNPTLRASEHRSGLCFTCHDL
jgi:predicted CXXCH cytochrome family protein